MHSCKNLKRLGALLLVLVMMFSLSGGAFADENPALVATEATVNDNTVENGTGTAVFTTEGDTIKVAVTLTPATGETLGGEPQEGEKDGTQNYHLTILMTGLTAEWKLVTGGDLGGQYDYDDKQHTDWNVTDGELMLWLPVKENTCTVVLQKGDVSQVVEITTKQEAGTTQSGHAADYTHKFEDYTKPTGPVTADTKVVCATADCAADGKEITIDAYYDLCTKENATEHGEAAVGKACKKCGYEPAAQPALKATGATVDNNTVKNGTGTAAVATENGTIKVAVTLTPETGKTLGGDPQKGETNGTQNYHLTISMTGLTTEWALVAGGSTGGQYGYDDEQHKDWNVAEDKLMLWLPVAGDTCKVVLQKGDVSQVVEVTTKQETGTTPGAHPDGYVHVFADYESDGNGGYKCKTTGCTETITAAKYQELCGAKNGGHDWDATTGICDTCKAQCEHASYENGVCEECGYTCTHSDTKAQPLAAKPGHHEIVCKTCTKVITADEACTYGDTPNVKTPTCTKCGYVHVHKWSTGDGAANETAGTGWKVDATTGQHYRYCTDSDCPVKADARNEITVHVYDQAGDKCVCGAVKPHEHHWAATYETNATYHWKVCDAAGCSDPAATNARGEHTFADGADTCSVCGFAKDEYKPSGHVWASAWTTNATDPTHHWHECEAEHKDGDQTTTCSVTDNALKDGYGEHIYDQADADGNANTVCVCGAVKPHEHKWAAAWESDETQHWHECENPGCDIQENAKAAHTFGDWTVTKEASATEAGSKERTCSVCSYKETVTIPATGSGDDPAPAHTATFAAHTKADFDADGKCTKALANGDPCTYTRANFQRDCTVDHSTIATTATCSTCGAAGTKSSGGTSSSGGGGGGGSTSKPSTTTNADGSTTTTTTDPKTGVKTETTTKTDGSTVVTETQKDGTSTTVETSASGQVETTVKLSNAAVTAAGNKPIELPVAAVPVATSVARAQPVTISAEKAGTVKVKIPTTSAGAGTVVAIVKADGTTEILKTSVAVNNGVLAELPSGSTVKIIDNGKSFADVGATNWANHAVEFVSARELMVGTSSSNFSPNEPMSCAMMVTILARLDGANTEGGATWYEKGMNWAAQNGVNNTISAQSIVTREQLAIMIWRYMGSPEANASLAGYNDANAVSGDADTAMRWAVENGIIVGEGNGILNPQGQTTRAEFAQILQNFLTKLAQ